jgi:hypothetical protein
MLICCVSVIVFIFILFIFIWFSIIFFIFLRRSLAGRNCKRGMPPLDQRPLVDLYVVLES